MARIGVTEILETLGLKDHSTSRQRTRAVFVYEPLLRLYKLEIPSLFGLLLRDEGTFLDRDDPALFQVELEKLLIEFGPRIWPLPGQGPRDHLLKPSESSLYTSDLVYPKDKDILVGHLRNLILNKNARSNVDVDALIEKRHQDARLKVFSKAEPDNFELRKRKIKEDIPKRKTGDTMGGSWQVSITDSSSESSDSDAPLVKPKGPRRPKNKTKPKSTGQPDQVALRIYRTTDSDCGPSHSYGTIFLDNDSDTAAECFARIRQHTSADCTYIVFYPPEDMSLEGRIRIDLNSKEADDTFERMMTMFREARKFPGEPSYRTIEVEIGIGTDHSSGLFR